MLPKIASATNKAAAGGANRASSAKAAVTARVIRQAKNSKKPRRTNSRIEENRHAILNMRPTKNTREKQTALMGSISNTFPILSAEKLRLFCKNRANKYEAFTIMRSKINKTTGDANPLEDVRFELFIKKPSLVYFFL
jgi:hypothetical protein